MSNAILSPKSELQTHQPTDPTDCNMHTYLNYETEQELTITPWPRIYRSDPRDRGKFDQIPVCILHKVKSNNLKPPCRQLDKANL